jgi:hypothetical protein
MDWTLIGVTVYGTFSTIIGVLAMRQLDSLRESIKLLFTKKDALERDLNEFKLHVAGRHYESHTVDEKFGKLEDTFKEELRSMGGKFDRLTDLMMQYFAGNGDRK